MGHQSTWVNLEVKLIKFHCSQTTMKLYILISVAVVYFAVASMGKPTRPDVELEDNGQEAALEDNVEEALERTNCTDSGEDCSKSKPCCIGKGFSGCAKKVCKK